MIVDHTAYAQLISVDDLFQAWEEFRIGKRKKNDVQMFEQHLEDNLFSLHFALQNKTYVHGGYEAFFINDPKRRHIHKASVGDRVVHHLLYKYLYAIFDRTFIHDSYSCRLDKGTHKGVSRLAHFVRIVSMNYTKSCWVLQCDIKRFFATVDHGILLRIVKERIADRDIVWLLTQVVSSFDTEGEVGKGIPLGNLTSQIFANIYMNELDQFVKQRLKIYYYIRYADDFLVVANDREELEQYLVSFRKFLTEHLLLTLHPQKISYRKLVWGVDFLGYITLPHYCLPRTKTKRRMFQKLKMRVGTDAFVHSLRSYLGYLSHANSFKVTKQLKNQIWLWRGER